MVSITAEQLPDASERCVDDTPAAIDILSGLAAAENVWRALERHARMSPYQRYDWVKAFADTAMAGQDIRVALIRTGSEAAALLLPLAVSRRLGVTVASGIGGKHANFTLPPISEAGASLSPERLARLLRDAGRSVGADVIDLEAVPASWDGQPTAFAGLGRPHPSPAYQVRLERDPEATALRSMSSDGRKRLRSKARGLAKLGQVAMIRAGDGREVDRLLAAFFAQKEERFRSLGITDPFHEPGARAFIRSASLSGLAEGQPGIELYGLTVGDRIVAVLGGAADANRLSGMFISFADWPEAAKFSPGDVLVSHIIREQCALGRGYFDLGVGEARYKRTFCDEPMALVDVVLPVTAAGGAYALARRGKGALKRRVKSSPAAMRAVAVLRRARAALRA